MTPELSTSPVRDGIWPRFRTWLARLWQRYLTWSRGPEPPQPLPPPPPPGHATQRQELTDPFVVPARGHVFDFQAYAAVDWSSDGLTREELNGRVQSLARRVRSELRKLIGDVARDYAPQRAGELEIELNRVLDARGPWRFNSSAAGVVRCHPHVRVALDDRVRQYVQPYWERRIKMECAHDFELRRAQLAEELTQRWLAVLEKLCDSPLADGAARLAEKELAEIVAEMRGDQKKAADQMQGLLDIAVSNSAGLGAYERAEMFDVVVEELRRRTARYAGGRGGTAATSTRANGNRTAEPMPGS